jgi:DNA-binding beta-propeller fold protein YncE
VSVVETLEPSGSGAPRRRSGSGRRIFGVAGLCALVVVAVPGFVAPSGAAAEGTLSVFAGTGASGAPTPGPATSSDLDAPTDVVVAPSGDVYIADADNNQVLKVTPDGTLSVFAGTGASGVPTPGPATSSDLDYPVGIAVDASGNVYIADEGNFRIEKVTPEGTLSVFAGTGTPGVPTPGPATSSALSDPVSVAIDSSGNVYIADQGSYRVLKVTPDGTLSVFAGTGSSGAPTPGPATSSPMMPFYVAVDSSDDVYIADGGSNRVLKVTAGGTLSFFAGTGVSGLPTPGPATSSALGSPYGLRVDASGNVYVADYESSMVVKITAGGTLSIFAGTGTAGSPTPGPATSSDLNYPWGVGVDASGNVYIADTGNSLVLKVSGSATVPNPPTAVTGIAGDGSVTVSWDPPGIDGGSPITGYTVTASPGGATCTTTGQTSCVVTGLANGTGYTFTVTARNAEGTSSPSSPSGTVTPTAFVEPRFTG